MVINKPTIEVRGDKTFLLSSVKDEITGNNEEFYFSVSNEYGKYLCNEVADAFVIAMLLPALVSGQNIKVDAPISEMLSYQLNNSLIFTFCKVFNKKPITIFPASTLSIDFNPEAVATGISGGVDTFTTIITHTSVNCPEGLRLTHLTLFNVGAYGNDETGSQKAFEADAVRAAQYAEYLGLPLVLLNSNISKICVHKDIFHFVTRSIISIIAGIYSLQKLFKLYLISSGHTIDKTTLNRGFKRNLDQGRYDVLIASLFSNLNTRFIVANVNLNRVEKTKLIAEDKTARKFLYVCAADIYNEKHGTSYKKDTSPNCSECEKCTRTLLTLDVLGYLDEFSGRFDLRKYANLRKNLIIKVLNTYKKNHYFNEIHDLMIEKNYHIPNKYRLQANILKIKVWLVSFKLIRFIYRSVIRPAR